MFFKNPTKRTWARQTPSHLTSLGMIGIRSLKVLPVALVFLFLAVTTTTAQTSWQSALDDVETILQSPDLSQDNRLLLRAKINEIIAEASATALKHREAVTLLQNLIATLGPEPKDDEAAESAELSDRRHGLQVRITRTLASLKQAEIAIIRGEQFLQNMVDVRREELWDKLKARAPIPLLPSTWSRALLDVRIITSLLRAATSDWVKSTVDDAQWKRSAGIISATLLLSIFLGWPLRLFLLRRFGQVPGISDPSYLRRFIAAPIEGIGRGLLPALALVSVLVVLISLELIQGIFASFISTVVSNFVVFLLIATTAQVTFAPSRPEWRLVPFTDDSAKLAAHRFVMLAAILAIANTLAVATQWVPVSLELVSVFTLFFGTACSFSVILLMQEKVWVSSSEAGETFSRDGKKRNIWPRIRNLVSIVAVAAPMAGLFGYIGVTAYLLINIILTGLLFAGMALLHGLFGEAVKIILSDRADLPGPMRRFAKMGDGTRSTLAFSLTSLFDLVILIAASFVAMSVWGMQPEDIYTTANKALQGFSIGSYTFSLTSFFLAAFLFVAVLLGTRAIQWVIEDRIFPHTNLDRGIKDSLSKAIWYVGLITGAFIAVSTLGIDFSNFAIVAGALSVGIGFGLQNLVNNFVSGIILLIERPLKVGDWVVVGAQEGHVKRINVRSTEISTFQKATVIVPNADILSNSLTNWTHRDPEGRVDIIIGVAYGSNVEKVKETLLKCAKDHDEVKSYPEPDVLFMDFADSSLLFELRAYVKSIEKRIKIASDIRYAIDAAFRENKIEIPFPQRVIHKPADT